jgi:hypothetical protein
MSGLTPAPAPIALTIKRTTGGAHLISVLRTDTIAEVKRQLEALTGRPSEAMMLTYAGKEMDPTLTVADYCSQDGTLAVFLR